MTAENRGEDRAIKTTAVRVCLLWRSTSHIGEQQQGRAFYILCYGENVGYGSENDWRHDCTDSLIKEEGLISLIPKFKERKCVKEENFKEVNWGRNREGLQG